MGQRKDGQLFFALKTGAASRESPKFIPNGVPRYECIGIGVLNWNTKKKIYKCFLVPHRYWQQCAASNYFQ